MRAGLPLYLALMSAETSLLVRAMDDAAIAQKLLSLRSSGLLASGGFSSTAAAMCWLTDPVPADVVSSAESSGGQGPVDGGWLAVASGGAKSCINVASSGVGGAVKLLKESVSPVCAVGRFERATDAFEWLAGSSAEDLLQLLGDTVCAATAASVPRVSAPPTPALMDRRRMRVPEDDALSSATKRSIGSGQQSVNCVGGVRGEVGLLSAYSPFNPRCAHAAVQRDTPDQTLPTERVVKAISVRHSGRASTAAVSRDEARSRKRPAPDLAQSPRAPPGARVAVDHGGESGCEGPLVHMPKTKGSAPSQILCTCDLGTSFSGEGSSRPVFDVTRRDRRLPARSPVNRRCTCAAALSKVRYSTDGGVGVTRNPAGGPKDDSRSVFSRANISRIVAQGAAVWEQYDSDVALALSLQDVEARPRRSLVPLTAAVLQTPRACTPFVGSAASYGGADSAVPIGGIETSVTTAPSSQRAGAPAPGPTGAASHSPAPPSTVLLAAGTGAPVSSDCVPSPQASQGVLGSLAAAGQWQDVFDRLAARGKGVFVTGGPGVGKSTFLRGLHKTLCARWPLPGQVVIVAPTGSAAKTANGQTYHSFFGFPRDYRVQHEDPADEASRFLKEERFRPMARRFAQVRVLLLDEVSMVAADKFDVMVQLLRQARSATSPPCMVFSFGDFLQLGPVGGGAMAFTAQSWHRLYGSSMLELSRVYRQSDAAFVRAIADARFGHCTAEVSTLMQERSVTDQEYKALRCSVLHIMPRHEDVELHNARCLAELCRGALPKEFVAVDAVEQDKDRDVALPSVLLSRVTEHSRCAALVDCVAPRIVQHCLGARVMLTCNIYLMLGLYHGSIGCISSYLGDGTPVVRFEHNSLPAGVGRGLHGVHDAGVDWLEVECPRAAFEARILACPGAVAVRRQVPFALGWGITVHRSQSLSLSEAVLDIAQAFGPGMVNAAISRVSDKRRMYVKSFSGSRLLADPEAVRYYNEGSRM